MAGMPNLNLNQARQAAGQQRLFSKGTAEVPVSDLLPSPENGRKKLRAVEGLAESFDGDGVVQALTVVPAAAYVTHYPQHTEYVEKSGKPYVVLHGHRRLAAAQMKGLEKVPVFVRKTVAENGSLRLSAIKENEQRLGLDPIEEGAEYQAALKELGISQRELSKKLGGISQTAISHKIKLLKLIEPLQQAVIDHWCKQKGLELEFGGERLLPIKEAATILAGLRPDLQQAYVDGQLSMAQAEAIVKSKVPLEEQQLPGTPQTNQTQPNNDEGQGEQPAGNNSTNQNQAHTQQQNNAGQGDQKQNADQGGADESNPGGDSSLPGQRSTDNEKTQDADQDQSENKPGTSLPTTQNAASAGGTGTTGTVATVTERGVIPVTTVKDIYTGLKEHLSPEEFEELQELILND
ncbi:ParB/RepB/Spo0J family partition protein [Streptomyces sp. NPDC014986]|uniref:ParB/RepB/Spo0J family partition protein n=1 Tax=Streptomyces sp. NPDC014986 TaxID=3364934 RepID=UPI0037027C19